MAKIYLASSWRCAAQPAMVETLRGAGHEVYDFRNPRPGDNGFSWKELHPDLHTSTAIFREQLKHPIAVRGFRNDMDALLWCDTCVLLLPCGRSAHLELGWACGAGKRTDVVMPDGQEPELMYSMLGEILRDKKELLSWLKWGAR